MRRALVWLVVVLLAGCPKLTGLSELAGIGGDAGWPPLPMLSGSSSTSLSITRPIGLSAVSDGRLGVASVRGLVELYAVADGGFSRLGSDQSTDIRTFYATLRGGASNDGGVELAVLNINRSEVTFLDVAASGSLARSDVATVDRPGGQDFLFADFNRDGLRDVALLSAAEPLVGLAQADGGFVFGPALVSDPNAPTELAVGDFNGDAISDLAMVTFGAARLTLWRGNGDGSFASPTFLAPPVGMSSLLVVDIDRDGHDDLLTGGGEGIETFLGLGDGTFAPALHTTGFGAMKLVAADFDGTGVRQLAAADYWEDRVVILDWSGGALVVRGSHPVGDTPRELAVSDFNRDGRLDLAVACDSANRVELLLDVGR